MGRLLFSALVASLSLVSPEGIRAAGPATSSATELVRQLGDADFQTRREAEGNLRRLGVEGLAALQAARNDADLEIRQRVRRLLSEIEVLDHEQRLAAFADRPGEADDDLLPGLREYRGSVGEDSAACDLLVRMQRAEPMLFRLLDGEERLLQTAYEQRGVELQYTMLHAEDRKEALDSIFALLFIGSDPRVRVSEQTASQIASFLHYHEFRTALLSGECSGALRKLLGRWIAGADIANPYLKVNLALQYGIPEGVQPAVEMLEGPGLDSQAQYAVLALARFGDRGHVPVLERLLDDRTVLTVARSHDQVNYTCQIRDVALAALVHLTEQDIADYSFSRLTMNPQYLFSPSSTGFRNDEDRQSALARWQTWRKEHLHERQPTEPLGKSATR